MPCVGESMSLYSAAVYLRAVAFTLLHDWNRSLETTDKLSGVEEC